MLRILLQLFKWEYCLDCLDFIPCTKWDSATPHFHSIKQHLDHHNIKLHQSHSVYSSIALVIMVLKHITTIPTCFKSKLIVYIMAICQWDINTTNFEVLPHLYCSPLFVKVEKCLGYIVFIAIKFVFSMLPITPLMWENMSNTPPTHTHRI